MIYFGMGEAALVIAGQRVRDGKASKKRKNAKKNTK